MLEKIVITVDPDIVDLIPGYLENRHRDVATMNEALQKSDYEVLRKIGHDLKGSGAGYGLEAITEMGRALESAAKNSDNTEITRIITEFAAYLSRIEIA